MKRDKISIKQNIFDLVPRVSSFFLILRDNVEIGHEKKNLNIKKVKKFWSETGKSEGKYWHHLLTILKKVTAKLNFQLAD